MTAARQTTPSFVQLDLAPRRRQRILAVTDDLTARMIAKSYPGCQLAIAHTSAEALILVRRGHASFDLVLCLLPIPAALALHAAIATQDPRSAGRMAVMLKP